MDILWRETGTGVVAVWLGNGLNAPTATAVIGGAPMTWSIESLNDLNGDGKADILWRETSTGAVAVWLGNGRQASSAVAVVGRAPLTWQLRR